MGELETDFCMPDRRGRHNDASAWKACDHERRKRLVAKGTVTDVRQCVMMRERENAEYRELHEIMEYMNEKQVWIRGHDGTITNADGRSPGNLGRSNVRRSRIWTTGSRRGGGVVGEDKEMRELLKVRRTTKMEGWRGTDAAEGL